MYRILAMQTSGKPGSVLNLIRGISTFGASNSALVLADGSERLDEINVEDVESFPY